MWKFWCEKHVAVGTQWAEKAKTGNLSSRKTERSSTTIWDMFNFHPPAHCGGCVRKLVVLSGFASVPHRGIMKHRIRRYNKIYFFKINFTPSSHNKHWSIFQGGINQLFWEIGKKTAADPKIITLNLGKMTKIVIYSIPIFLFSSPNSAIYSPVKAFHIN